MRIILIYDAKNIIGKLSPSEMEAVWDVGLMNKGIYVRGLINILKTF